MNKEDRIDWLIGWHCLDAEYVYGLSEDELEEECYRIARVSTNNFLEVSGLKFNDEGDLEPDDEWEGIFESE